MGYAEKEPDFDINGIDSAHKIIILTALAFGKWISMDNVFVQGISEILPLDIQIADELGYKIKLIAESRKEDGKLGVRVCPTMIPKSNVLSSISNVYNAVLVEGDFVGPTLYYGLGAGKNPTASAVWSDICYIAQKLYHRLEIHL
jgi:homoserine dehydrogenase